MEREIMVEEMVNDIEGIVNNILNEMKDQHQGNNILYSGLVQILYSYQRRKQIAEYLVSKNYRKFSDGAVVLTKEEYEKLKNKPPFALIKFDEEKMKQIAKETANNFVLEFTKKGKDKIRKETAREILEKVGNIEDCGGVLLKQYKWFVDLCKENGVDVE